MIKAWCWMAGLVLLAGCTTQPPTSRKADHTVAELRVKFENPATFVMSTLKETDPRNPNHAREPTPEQWADMRQASTKLMSVVRRGLEREFPAMAAQQSLQVVSDRLTVHTLLVSVVTAHGDCGAWKCAVKLKLRGDVLGTSGNSIWFFVRDIGQDSYDDTIDATLFAPFAAEVLALMRADGLLVSKPQ